MNLRLQRILLLPAMVLCLAPLFTAIRGGVRGEEVSGARRNYYRLDELYRKWDEGLFGSRNYHRRELESFLTGIIRGEIETDYDCMVDASAGASDGSVRCSIGWLTLRGPLDGDSLKEAASGRPGLLRNWWRSGVLVSVRGRVRRFSIDSVHRDVVLYLERITVLPNNAGTATKKN